MNGREARLRKARENAGYSSAAKAAGAIGINASTYRAHENGQNDYGFEEAERYVRFFRVPTAWLFSGQNPVNGSSPLTKPDNKSETFALVPVLGFVKAGAWQDIDDGGSQQMAEYVPSASEYPADWQYAYTVDGPSINKTARSGDRLICLDLGKSGLWFKDGDLVIAERLRFGGQMIERSAKRVRQTLGGFELWPESDDPAHQDPIPFEANGDGDMVRVTARVLWVLRKP